MADGTLNVDAPAAARDLSVLAPLLDALVKDLEFLVLLHDREPTAALLGALKSGPIASQLAIRLTGADGQTALQAFDAAVDSIPTEISDAMLDDLCADYADVYLRHVYHARATESYWLTEDHLERQGPMLALRAVYRSCGLRLTDWAGRPEDHLVAQLLFLARQLSGAQGSADVARVVHFLDDHILRWIKAFAARLVSVHAPPFYSALAVLTATWLDEVRDHLGEVTGIARPAAPAHPEPLLAAVDEADAPYIPGMAPSW